MIKQIIYCCICSVLIGLPSCKDNASKNSSAVAEEFPINIDSLRIRDPFIFVDKVDKCYYLQARDDGKFRVYKSKDLENWKDLGNSFIPDSSFWGTKDFWAPDMYYHNGKYYIFATFSSDKAKRGTSILISDKPEGPYQPLTNESTTPPGWMCLDGALYFDKDENPWMLYCHEWLEVYDGEIVAQRLSDDFKSMIGDPIVLFKASEAPWTTTTSGEGKTGYVTDAPFIYKLKDGSLMMTWSSFEKVTNKYAIGQAYSRSGNLLGPWVQDSVPINSDDGGHAMIFNDLDGQLRISYHAPNSQEEKPTIRKIAIDDDGRISFL